MGIVRSNCSRPRTAKSTRPKIELPAWAWSSHPCLLDSVKMPKIPRELLPTSSTRKNYRNHSRNRKCHPILLPPVKVQRRSRVPPPPLDDTTRSPASEPVLDIITQLFEDFFATFRLFSPWLESVTSTMTLAGLTRRTRKYSVGRN